MFAANAPPNVLGTLRVPQEWDGTRSVPNTSSAHRSVVFAGGGTAGHLFPGLAVAEHLSASAEPPAIVFVGSGRDTERQWAEEAGFRYRATPCRHAPRSWREVAPCLWRNLRGLLAARRLLQDEACGLVVGLGGYASLPAACAALSLGIPLVLLEQNVAPGLTTRLLARWAQRVCVSFPETQGALPRPDRVRVTGTPIRAEFVRRALKATAARSGRRQLLILGGSGGARSLNRNVPEALARVAPLLKGWQIVHQSGANDADSTRLLYARVGLKADVRPFVSDMPHTLASTDVAVCRAGGATLAELAALGVPAVLVPYPHAAGNHQQKNAEWAVAAGGRQCVREGDSEAEFTIRLAEAVVPLVGDEAERIRQSALCRQSAKPDAAERVAAEIWNVLTPG